MRTKPLKPALMLIFSLSWAVAETPEPSTILHERPAATVEQKRMLPKNLARWHMGTTLITTDDNANGVGTEWALPSGPKQTFGILLSDDETESMDLEIGTHAYIFNFQGPELIDRFFTKSFGAGGKIRLLGSDSLDALNSDSWRPLGRKKTLDAGEFLEHQFVPSEYQYIAIIYEISEAGEIGNIGLTGTLNLAETYLPSRLENQSFAQRNSEEDEDSFAYDFATTYSGSSIPFTSDNTTLEEIEHIIDDDFRTYYDVEPSKASNAMLIDLNEATYINKVTLLFQAQAGTLDFFFLDNIPGDEQEPESSASLFPQIDPPGVHVFEKWTDKQGRPYHLAQSTTMSSLGEASDSTMREIVLEDTFFNDLKARYSQEVEAGEERISIPVDNQTTRYLLLRWTPADPAQGATEVTLRIYELSVFGPMPADEPLVERGLIDELAPAAGGDIANLNGDQAPGSPGDPVTPPQTTETPEEPLVPAVTAISQ